MQRIVLESPLPPLQKGGGGGIFICSEPLYGLRLAILRIYNSGVSVTSVADYVCIFALRMGWL